MTIRTRPLEGIIMFVFSQNGGTLSQVMGLVNS